MINRKIDYVMSYLKDKYDFYTSPVQVVSFPKCGRTWLRLMVGYYFKKKFGIEGANNNEILELTPLHKYSPSIPKINVTHDDKPHLKKPNELKETKDHFKNKRTLFMVRDPKDVMVSLYFQLTERQQNVEKISIHEFIRGRYELDSLIKFYKIWHNERKKLEEFFLLKYENLHHSIYEKNKIDVVQKVISFISNDEVDPRHVRDAVEHTTFEKMRKMEKQGTYSDENKRLRPTDEEDIKTYKTRSGEVGGYVNHLSERDVKYIDKKVSNELPSEFYGS